MTDFQPTLDAPILETLLRYRERGITPLHTPGHKGGRFVPQQLRAALGEAALSLDFPSMEATDNSFHPRACIRDAQRLAAELYGAAETRFLVGGSTMGIAAMIMAAAPPGTALVLPRNIHLSVFSALVLSGARPRFLMPKVLPACGALGLSGEQVRQAIESEPRPAAVLLTRPTYFGVAGPMAEIVSLCRERGVAVLVDEAHGAHLPFLPPGHVDPSLTCGADAVVQSPHKTLTALVGAAQLHLRHDGRLDAERLQRMLNLLQSTSPNYLLLSSLDACRLLLKQQGRQLLAAATERATELRRTIARRTSLPTLELAESDQLAGHQLDPLRLVVHVGPAGVSGYEAQDFLRHRHRIEPEFCDPYNLIFILGPGDSAETYERLVVGLEQLVAQASGRLSRTATPPAIDLPEPQLALLPREAVFAETSRVPLWDAVDRVCGEVVSFYPPGIPLIMPGELVTRELVETCQYLKHQDAYAYASDSSLETLLVTR
jgi:lysine decarboxylase